MSGWLMGSVGCGCCPQPMCGSGCVSAVECSPSGFGQAASNVDLTVWQDGILIGSGNNLGPCASGVPPGSGVGCWPYCFALPSGSDPVTIFAHGGANNANASGVFDPSCSAPNTFVIGFGGLFTFHIRVNNASTCTTHPIWFGWTATATDPDGAVLGTMSFPGGTPVADFSFFVPLPLAGPEGTPVTLTLSQNASPRYASSFVAGTFNAAPCGQRDVFIAYWIPAPNYYMCCCRDPIHLPLLATNGLGAFTLDRGVANNCALALGGSQGAINIAGTNCVNNGFGANGNPGSCVSPQQVVNGPFTIGLDVVNTVVGGCECGAIGGICDGFWVCTCVGPFCFQAPMLGQPSNVGCGAEGGGGHAELLSCDPFMAIISSPGPAYPQGETTITESP